MFEYLSYWELKSEGHKRHYISEIASLVIELPSKRKTKYNSLTNDFVKQQIGY